MRCHRNANYRLSRFEQDIAKFRYSKRFAPITSARQGPVPEYSVKIQNISTLFCQSTSECNYSWKEILDSTSNWPNTHPNLSKRLCIKGKRRGGCFVNTPPNTPPNSPPKTHPSGRLELVQGGMLGLLLGLVLGWVLGGVLKTRFSSVYRGFRRFWGGC